MKKLHRLSLKLAGVAAGAAGLAGLVAWALGAPLWGAVLGVVLAGGSVYAASYRLLARRLGLANSTLRQIRRHRFERLEAVHLPKGDEMNDLIWQVYRTGQALEAEMQRLKKMEDYRREFVGTVSHELKTPTFAIQGFAETLLDGALDDERVRRTFVEKILRNADRMNHLARDLAAIARIETGELQMQEAPFALPELVREVNESLELAAEAKEIVLDHRFPDTLPPVVGDRNHLRQVLSNLVDNAIKYANPGGRVAVVVRQLPEGPVKVAVVDDGIGISKAHIERLTERFYRVDRSRSRDQGGTGLGLAIVKHILSAHGAELTVDSVPGRGSTFGFTLPAAGLREGERVDGAGSAHSFNLTLSLSSSRRGDPASSD